IYDIEIDLKNEIEVAFNEFILKYNDNVEDKSITLRKIVGSSNPFIIKDSINSEKTFRSINLKTLNLYIDYFIRLYFFIIRISLVPHNVLIENGIGISDEQYDYILRIVTRNSNSINENALLHIIL